LPMVAGCIAKKNIQLPGRDDILAARLQAEFRLALRAEC
jgi:hypothetical protein